MSTVTQAPTDREAIPEVANPLGMDGIEFIEYTTSKPQALGQVLEMMGFRPVARHRSREVMLYRQGGMNVIVNAHIPAGVTSIRPMPSDFGKTLDAYRALEALLADGKVRAIGVSNFMVDHLRALLDAATVVPAVNQLEIHPYFQQREVQAFDSEHGILDQAWSPIGGITFYRDSGHTNALEDPVIGEIARAHGKSPAQVMLRWGLQQGRSVIPKSTKPERIAENLDVFDFDLTADELAAIDALDTGQRGGPEPEVITLEAFGRPIPEN